MNRLPTIIRKWLSDPDVISAVLALTSTFS